MHETPIVTFYHWGGERGTHQKKVDYRPSGDCLCAQTHCTGHSIVHAHPLSSMYKYTYSMYMYVHSNEEAVSALTTTS